MRRAQPSRGGRREMGAGGILHYVQGGLDARCALWPGGLGGGGQRVPRPPPA